MSAKKLSRRRFLKSVGATAGAVFLSSRSNPDVWAEFAPCPQIKGKEIRWIVPNNPGGGNDIISRVLAPFYGEKLGAKVVVNNMPGAGTILGSKILKQAPPDGLTQGLLSTPGLLVASLTGEIKAPNPVRDFTILGQVMKNRQIWATGGGSPFKTIKDVLMEAQKRAITFGITEVGASNFVNAVVTSSLLGIDAEFVSGYRGRRGTVLAAMRGEVDVIAFTLESILVMIESGDLRPLLQISDQRISPHSCLDGVPLLAGDDGMAANRAAELGRDVEEAKTDAAALADVIGGGRLVAAPLGLDEGLARCLGQKLYQALKDPDFEAAAAGAGLAVEAARAEAASSEFRAVAERAERFIPIVRSAIRKAQR